VVLDSAGGFCSPESDTSVDEVAQRDQRYQCSYHRAPSFRSPCHVDSQVTSQVLVGIFTLEVGFTGVNVPFVIVVGVYVDSIFGHGVTSSAGDFFWGENLAFANQKLRHPAKKAM
jgi:hypothetical protein